MSGPTNITPAIVDALYEEALTLSEEARSVFDRAEIAEDGLSQVECTERLALSCETLRTTTRLMHAIAFLINHRAFFAGDMTEFQLRRHGQLPPAEHSADEAEQWELLTYGVRDISERSKAFYSRIARLDHAWRDHFTMDPPAVERLRRRVGAAFGAH